MHLWSAATPGHNFHGAAVVVLGDEVLGNKPDVQMALRETFRLTQIAIDAAGGNANALAARCARDIAPVDNPGDAIAHFVHSTGLA